MYSTLSGGANDVSMLIDYLPSYLFPNDEHKIVECGIAGKSLGGECAWICLAKGLQLLECGSPQTNALSGAVILSDVRP
jgi:hypothetical protein